MIRLAEGRRMIGRCDLADRGGGFRIAFALQSRKDAPRMRGRNDGMAPRHLDGARDLAVPGAVVV